MTKVKIETFKDSGKWYSDCEYDSKFTDTTQLLNEAAQKVPQTNMDYTVEMADGNWWNKYLVKISKNKRKP